MECSREQVSPEWSDDSFKARQDITGGARMNTSATVYTPENQPIFPVRFDRPISHVCASPPSNTYRTHPEIA